MEIIFVTRSRRNLRRVHLGHLTSRIFTFGVIAAVLGAFTLGYQLSSKPVDPRPDLYAAAWDAEVEAQRREVSKAITYAGANMDALATRLGELQARVVRLDALGGRLVEMAKLDKEEFAFGNSPAIGGLPAASDESLDLPDFLDQLGQLAGRLEDRKPKLEAIETAMMSWRLLEAMSPSGRPVLSGWVSSRFGWRTDPISGRKKFHEGIDFAGRKGAPVVAVAAGVVMRSGRRSGYGNVVEINHGNELMTRYAHNSANLVKIGEKIEKGSRNCAYGLDGLRHWRACSFRSTQGKQGHQPPRIR